MHKSSNISASYESIFFISVKHVLRHIWSEFMPKKGGLISHAWVPLSVGCKHRCLSGWLGPISSSQSSLRPPKLVYFRVQWFSLILRKFEGYGDKNEKEISKHFYLEHFSVLLAMFPNLTLKFLLRNSYTPHNSSLSWAFKHGECSADCKTFGKQSKKGQPKTLDTIQKALHM